MRLLLDTHLLIWVVFHRAGIPKAAIARIEEPANAVLFSVVSLWEIAIKRALGRLDFRYDARAMRAALLRVGYQELPITADHAFAVADLPAIHSDPFDRLLIAQARWEGVTLLTGDGDVARYGGPIERV